jgi:hypothetical protein
MMSKWSSRTRRPACLDRDEEELVDPNVDIWLTSRIDSGYGIDEEVDSTWLLDTFVHSIELTTLALHPLIKLPALKHINLLVTLCVSPEGNRPSPQSSPLTLGQRCQRVLASIFKRIRDSNESLNEVLVAYEQLRTVFIPQENAHMRRSERTEPGGCGGFIEQEEETDDYDTPQRNLRTGKRINYAILTGLSDQEIKIIQERSERYETSFVDEKPRKIIKTESLELPDGLDFGNESNPKELPRLFADARDVWDMIGWAFYCSTIDDLKYRARWKSWQTFLVFVIEVLEKDCSRGFSRDTIVHSWINTVHHSVVLDAIFSVIPENALSTYSPVFPGEIELSGEVEQTLLRPHTCYETTVLRARLLDLVIGQYGREEPSNVDKVLEDCTTYTNDVWIFDILIPPTSLLRPMASNLIFRLALCYGLPVDLQKYRTRLVLRDIDEEILAQLLECTPSRMAVKDYTTTVVCLNFLILDCVMAFFEKKPEIGNRKSIKRKLKSAFKSGKKLRKKWLERKLGKSIKGKSENSMFRMTKETFEMLVDGYCENH